MIIAYQLYLVFAISLPYNALTITIPTSNLTSLVAEDDYTCTPKSSILSKAPTLKDCQNAINQLPRIGAGSFHNGPPDDPFKLPVEKTVGTCTVTVEMMHQGSTREGFSWLLIVEATLKLSKECLTSWLAPEPGMGGFIRFGKHGRLLSSVGYYKAVREGENIETA